jgi:hypothetical protein
MGKCPLANKNPAPTRKLIIENPKPIMERIAVRVPLHFQVNLPCKSTAYTSHAIKDQVCTRSHCQ